MSSWKKRKQSRKMKNTSGSQIYESVIQNSRIEQFSGKSSETEKRRKVWEQDLLQSLSIGFITT